MAPPSARPPAALLALVIAASPGAAQVRLVESAPAALAPAAAGEGAVLPSALAPAPLAAAFAPVFASPSPTAAPAAASVSAAPAAADALSAPVSDAPRASQSPRSPQARSARAEATVAEETSAWNENSSPATAPAAAPRPAFFPLPAAGAPEPSTDRRRSPPSPSRRLARAFDWSAVGGLIGAVPAGVLLNAMTPQLALYYALPLGFVGLVAALGLVQLGRRLSAARAPAAPPASGALLARSFAGLALGAALTFSTVQFEGPIVSAVTSVATPQKPLVAVPGAALRGAVIARLSENPVGRGVLARLTDRFGAVHVPPFFIQRNGDGSVADYDGMLDAVLIGADEIVSNGWTVEQFLKDPELQRRYVAEADVTFAHELTHAGQVRGSPFEPGQWGRANANFEAEYEAYMTEHFYLHAKFAADPRSLTPLEYGQYIAALDGGVDAYLEAHVTPLGYPHEVHVKSASYDAYIAKVRAAWPAHVVEGYALAARRNADRPKVAAYYKRRAAAYAAAHGLPAPL